MLGGHQPPRFRRLIVASLIAAVVALLAAGGVARAQDPSATTLSSSTSSATYGQSVTFTAVVTGSGACVPASGDTVSFSVDGGAVTNTPLASAGQGIEQALYTTSTLPSGPHTISAQYDGNASCALSTASITQIVTGAGPSTTTLTGTVVMPLIGTEAIFTASVAGVAAPCTAPTGSVAFYDVTGGINGLLGVAQLGAGPPSVAVFAELGFSSGAHMVVATYSGDGNCAPSSSVTITVTTVGSGLLTIGPNGQVGPASAAGTPYSGPPITILTGSGSPAVQILYAGCTGVSLITPAGTPVSAIASLVTPAGATTGIWRLDAVSRRYLAGYLSAPGAPVDFTVTNGGEETYTICTLATGTIRSMG